MCGKTTGFLTILLVFSLTVRGQDKDTIPAWRTGGMGNINFSQVALSHWAGGGQNSISATGLLSLYANYHKKKVDWENSADLAYGLLSRDKGPFIKSDDKIDLSSKVGRKAFDHTFYTAMLNFRSQFAPGYEYAEKDSVKISDFLAPGYLVATLGLDYKPADFLAVMVAPVSGKMTFVNDQTLADQGAYGVEPAVLDPAGNVIEPGKTLRTEFGGYFRASFQKKLMKNTHLKTKVSLFSNYLDEPQNIDVNWELLLSLKVNEFITASIATDLIYDDDIMIAVDEDGDGVTDAQGPRTQFKEVLSIGLSYSFDHASEASGK